MAPSTAVNRPIDIKQKEEDVNNKLQLYGIYSAFKSGKLPSNQQIDVALNSALASKPLSHPSKRLSPEGQKLAQDLKNIIEQSKLLVLTKNDGNLFQDFIWQTQQIKGGDAKAPNAPIEKDTARQHGSEALEGLRTLGTLIISNGQFRKLLSDVQILLRDMVGDAATNTASRISPTEEQLAQIDHPADDNVWHEVPDISRKNLVGQMKGQWTKNKSNQNATEGAANAYGAADPAVNRDPVDTVVQPGAEGQYPVIQANDAEELVPEEAKERRKKFSEKYREYWTKKVPKERREHTIFRLKKMVVEIQGHQDYMRAVETLLRLAEEYASHSRNLVNQGQGAVKGVRSDDSLQNAEADLKTLIERFANNTSLDDLFDSINQIYRDADQDEELRAWFKDLDTYIRRCLKEQGFIVQDAATDDWNELYDHGRYLLREKYKSHTDRIVNEFKFIINQFDEDPQNKVFAQSLRTLFSDLTNDENGKPAFKPHLIKDFTDVILPGLFENIRYVPVPRIEYTDPSIDAIVENLVIESDNFAPNVLELGSDNYWRWGRKKISGSSKNKIMLSVSGIQMDLRDVSYYVKRKQGSPRLSDQGVVDIFLGGKGLSFKVDMESIDKESKGSEGFFKVNKVSINIKNPSIKLKQSKHKLLFTLFRPLLLRLLRPALEKVVEKQIRDNLNQLNALAFSIQQEATKAEADFLNDPDPENTRNIYQRYMAAMNNQIMQGRFKAEEIVANRKLNVAVTQHDSMFKDISLPGGISTKATEFKELAARGEKWESSVFSIGSAGETRELPKVPKVSRKRHASTTTAGTTNGSIPNPVMANPLNGEMST